MNKSKWILLGSSQGLGKSFADILTDQKIDHSNYSRISGGFDASKAESWNQWFAKWNEENPTHIACFIGGGPFGAYPSKNFVDHQWALRVNFEFQAYLLHQVLSRKTLAAVQQICFIGSAIAESKPDPRAASYAAGKHALKGLVTSVQKEEHQNLDIRLFSPGYLDTSLLPKNAWPRQTPGMVKLPQDSAKLMWTWLLDPTCANQHQVFE